MNLAEKLQTLIDEQVKKNFNRICKVRIFERKRSVGDLSISNTKSKSSILNFYIEEGPNGEAVLKKSAKQSTRGYIVTEMPVDVTIKDLKQRYRRLDLWFDCDVTFLDGTRRYDGRDDEPGPWNNFNGERDNV